MLSRLTAGTVDRELICERQTAAARHSIRQSSERILPMAQNVAGADAQLEDVWRHEQPRPNLPAVADPAQF